MKKYLLLILGLIILTNLVGATAFTDGLRAYWSFNESSGTNATDVIRNWGIPTNASWDTGVYGTSALNLNNSFTAASSSNWLTNYSNYSITFWMNKTASSATNGFMNNLNSGNNPNENGEWRLIDNGNNASAGESANFIMLDIVDSVGRMFLTLPVNLTAGKYRHLAFTFNNTRMSFYVDGNLNVSYALNGFIPNNQNITLFTDTYGSTSATGRNFKIDELGLWNKTLNSSDVAAVNSSNYAFTGPPPIFASVTTTLVSPANQSVIGLNNTNFTASYSTIGINLTNATYYVWFANGTLFNQTRVNVNGTSNSTTLNIGGFNLGNYVWNVNACAKNSTGTICDFDDGNFSFTIGASLLSQIYSTNTYETSHEFFSTQIQLLSGSSLAVSQLVYNNTNYTITNVSQSGSTVTLSKFIDIPTNDNAFANQSNSFFWRFIFTDNSSTVQQSTPTTQSVGYINFQICNNTFNTQTLNFTLFDEINQTIILVNSTVTSSMESNWRYWIGGGDTAKNYSFQLLGSPVNNSYQFCFLPYNPSSYNFKIDSDLLYSVEGYRENQYHLRNATLTNVISSIYLYLINQDDATKFFLEFRRANILIADATVTVQKFFTGLGQYITVSILHTDDDGKATM